MISAIALDVNQIRKVIFDLNEVLARGGKSAFLICTDEEDANDQLTAAAHATVAPEVRELPVPEFIYMGSVTTLGFDAGLDSLVEAMEQDEDRN